MSTKPLCCRFCSTSLKHVFADLGSTPLSNSYRTIKQLSTPEPSYPLTAYVCEKCYLVQLEEFEAPENIFRDYAYFSSYSDSWLGHCRNYVNHMIDTYDINQSKQVIEIASNDGYLLQYFLRQGIPVVGIEPAENVANIARQLGISTIVSFFGVQLARHLTAKGLQADLLIGNNVLAHVPELNDFVRGLKILLKSTGVITMEFPHLLQLIKKREFDTIYHEHFSYFSLITVSKIFAEHGLTLFDVETLDTHGGSIRIYAKHSENESYPVTKRIHQMLDDEKKSKLDKIDTYLTFDKVIQNFKSEILSTLQSIKASGHTIVGYGAPAKGNTLLNYCGLDSKTISYTVDKNPHKQNTYLPGSGIPVHPPEMIKKTKPNYVLILPWNIKDEVITQLSFIREWGGKFIVLIPEIHIS